jgi:hypothetical protein
MPNPVRRSIAPVSLLSAAILAGGLLAPVGASARRGEAREAREANGTTETDGTAGPGEATATKPSTESPESPEPSPPPTGRRAGRGGKCRLSIEASSPLLTTGETASISGELLCPSSRSAAGETLTVYARERGEGAGMQEVGTASTAADGSYQFTTAALETTTVFYVRAQGAFSAHTVIQVAPKVTIAGAPADAQSSTAGGRPSRRTWMTFTGTVNPNVAGTRVALQREYTALGERWRTIAVSTVGAEGQYSFTHSFRAAGEMSVRVVVHSGRADAEIASEPLDYDIPQAQNPRLTIQGSSADISSGESVTITGVAAGAADATVTLLGRTRGHGFAVVARGTTGAGGEYKFTESPEQTTFYRVLDAGAASRELLVGFHYLLTAALSPSTAQAGKLLEQAGAQVTVSGTLTPAHPGQVVFLERQQATGVGFRVIASATISAGSSYSIPYTFSDPGSCVVRVRVPGDAEFESTTSEPFTILTTSAPTSPEGPA